MTLGLAIEDPAYFDRLAQVEVEHWWSRGMWRLGAYWLDQTLAHRNGLDALDVGCGTGFTMLRLRDRPEIREVFGLDPSIDALEHARRLHDMPLHRGSALDLPFEDDSFDVVTSFDVLQHLPDGGDRRAVDEMRRVLRPGGIALIRSNGRAPWNSRPTKDPSYRLRDLTDLFAEAGFRVRHASYANCLPALAQELRGHLPRLSRGRPGHPSGGGLQIRLPHPGINRMMGAVSGMEAWVAGACGVPLPYGHSTMLLAELDSRTNLQETPEPTSATGRLG
ncbi:class I SAM-dependent methyltransferase [Singulisphaera sp. PoT]|uniref:class I SAM-dependent methyltransferase n=1 Tax=Singulisphaera sp. PoT TaxID=3411797 RepID=UPI003BF5BFFE